MVSYSADSGETSIPLDGYPSHGATSACAQDARVSDGMAAGAPPGAPTGT